MGKENDESLRDRVIEKVIEMLECAKNIDNGGNFEITIKYINGELTTKIGFLE
jgi:hypothetical protein